MNPLDILKHLITVLIEQFVPRLGVTPEGIGSVLLDLVLERIPHDQIQAKLEVARAVQIDKAMDVLQTQVLGPRPTDPGED